jgi:hypothetical protein
LGAATIGEATIGFLILLFFFSSPPTVGRFVDARFVRPMIDFIL